jgi:hypothetical protein
VESLGITDDAIQTRFHCYPLGPTYMSHNILIRHTKIGYVLYH